MLILFLALPGAVSTTFGSPKVVMSVGSFLKSAPGAAYGAAGRGAAAMKGAPAAAKRAAASAGAAAASAGARAGNSLRSLGGGSKAGLEVSPEAAAAAEAAAATAAAAAAVSAVDGSNGKEAAVYLPAAAGADGVVDLASAPSTSQETPFFVCECGEPRRQCGLEGRQMVGSCVALCGCGMTVRGGSANQAASWLHTSRTRARACPAVNKV